jgi:benzoate/toluate 1,2-dioxygenase beta subunit
MSTVATSPQLNHEIEQFLYQEASYLDRPDLDSWIGLYMDDGTYWMPATPDQQDPEMHISLFYDDRVLMEVRRRKTMRFAPRTSSRTSRSRPSMRKPVTAL